MPFSANPPKSAVHLPAPTLPAAVKRSGNNQAAVIEQSFAAPARRVMQSNSIAASKLLKLEVKPGTARIFGLVPRLTGASKSPEARATVVAERIAGAHRAFTAIAHFSNETLRAFESTSTSNEAARRRNLWAERLPAPVRAYGHALVDAASLLHKHRKDPVCRQILAPISHFGDLSTMLNQFPTRLALMMADLGKDKKDDVFLKRVDEMSKMLDGAVSMIDTVCRQFVAATRESDSHRCVAQSHVQALVGLRMALTGATADAIRGFQEEARAQPTVSRLWLNEQLPKAQCLR